MKIANFVLSLAVVTFLTSTSWAATPLTLQAKSGEQITISYGYVSGHATNVQIKVQNAVPGRTRVVVLNKCSSNVAAFNRQEIYDCGYGENGTLLTPEYCTTKIISTGSANSDDVLSSRAGELQVEYLSRGQYITCDQEIAVSPQEGQWLVDPISGDHNFKFRLLGSR